MGPGVQSLCARLDTPNRLEGRCCYRACAWCRKHFPNRRTGSKSRVLEYDPVTNHWTQKRAWTNASCVDPGLDCNLSGPSAIMLSHLYVFGHYTADRSGGTGIFIYDPLSDTWASEPLLTTFSYWDETRLRAARVFVNGSPRVEVIGGYRPGNNQQYIP